ncbi:sec-independent translocase [Streptomyces sp. CBMA152]|uniref:sec-independent translocase n=1 Tax=Streptomyces sp. CBMA152 TaxID=1896312 RepID=UPI0016611011|nr:sec-independent translocase [Streptomyces sp. CBMA152]MBD0746708.1 preprotein translocase [Streptomyces sp. CBMA152]
MFTELSPMKLLVIAIVAVFVFGPDRLPEFIRNVTGFLRKVRAFADSAQEDIRSELGPEFKDFELQDLHPKTFVRKHVLEPNDGLGLEEIRSALDIREELAEASGVVREAADGRTRGAAPGSVSLTKDAEATASARPLFDPDAT